MKITYGVIAAASTLALVGCGQYGARAKNVRLADAERRRENRTGRLAVDQPGFERESLFAVHRDQYGQRREPPIGVELPARRQFHGGADRRSAA